MNATLIMLLIALGGLTVGAFVGWGIGYLKKTGKDPQAVLTTASTFINEAKVLNDDIGKLVFPASVESIIDRVIQVAQAGVHAAEQKCNSSQITKDQRNQNAYDAAMNMLKVAGYEPTPEIQQAVKDMIETGVFDMKKDVVTTDTVVTAPDQAVQQAIAGAVTQVVTPIAQQAASTAVNQAISQAATAVQGVLTPQPAAQANAQPAQPTTQAQTQSV